MTSTSAPEDDDDIDDVTLEAHGLFAQGKVRIATGKTWANDTFDKYRDRMLVDLGMRLYDRDKASAGTVISSAIAFRLFLFFVPLLLFVVGVVGAFASHVSSEDASQAVGVTGVIAQQINTALNQPTSTRWLAILFGLFGMATTGRTLSRALTTASCLAWRLPVRPKASVKVISGVIGIIVGFTIVISIVNRVRNDLGLAVTGLSLLAAFAVYTVGFLGLNLLLPRTTPDPGALIPGSVLIAATMVGLQAISQLYLPDKLSRASQLYGAIGITVVTLGWFFIAGRVLVLAMVLNAVLYERFGSITQFIFELPLVRILPRHSGPVRRMFGLEQPIDVIEPVAGDDDGTATTDLPAPISLGAPPPLPPSEPKAG